MGNGRWQNYKGRYLKMGKNYNLRSLTSIFLVKARIMIFTENWGHIRTRRTGKKGVYFAVWAPNAQAVSVIGEFNEWDTEKNPMKKVGPIGVYETFVPGAKIGQLYKFFTLQVHMVRSFTRQIHMPMPLKCVPEQLLVLQISPTINGKMIPG